MLRKSLSLISAGLLLGSSALFAADGAGPSAKFTIADKTKIPGATLKAGSYSIRVVDHLSDRLIVRVDAATGNTHSTFIALTNSRIPKPASPGAVNWNKTSGGEEYLRGWYFPNSNSVVEFVYPKADAVTIAKSNQSKVPAIDPASEGKVADKELPKDDMELVTLWLLSSTQVGPEDKGPAIKAERYQEVASAQQVPPSPGAAATPVSKAAAPRKPVIAKLPHTGSNEPWVWILGLFSLTGAGLFRLSARNQGSRS